MVKAEKRSPLRPWTLAAGTALATQMAAVTLSNPEAGNIAIWTTSMFFLFGGLVSRLDRAISLLNPVTMGWQKDEIRQQIHVIADIEKIAFCAFLSTSLLGSAGLAERLAEARKPVPPAPIAKRYKLSVRPAPLIVVPTPPSVIKL